MNAKRVSALLVVGSLLGLSAAAVADEPRSGAQVEVDRNGVHVDVGANARPATPPVKISDLLGLKVCSPDKEDLGKIEDLVLDPPSGKVRYAVLSFGGFLGLGDKLFAVPWKDLQLAAKGTTSAGTVKEDHFVLDVSKEGLKKAPGFDKSHWPNFADRSFVEDIDRFYDGQKTASPGSTERR